MYRHVFWDMGGTLVDTYPQLDRALADVVADHGGSVDVHEVSRLTRVSTGHAVAHLSTRFGVPEAAFEAAEEALKERWRAAPAPAMPGAAALLHDVRAAGGLNLVVTHRDRRSAESLLTGIGLEVDDLISTADGYPRKPDPAMYRAMLERHGLDPAQCLAVGDRPIDAEAAAGAGLATATLESPEAPVDDEADHSVAALDELRPLLRLAPAR